MKNIVKEYTYCKNKLPELIKSGEYIANNNESFGTFINGISKFFKSKVDSIKEIFSFNKFSLSNNNNQTPQDIGDLESLMKICRDISKRDATHYKRISPFVVPYIPGVDVDLPTLVEGLANFEKLVTTDIYKVFEEADTFIAKVTGDEKYRTSMTEYDTSKIVNIGTDINTYLTNTINGKILDDHRELGKVIPNLESLYETHVILNKLVKKINLKEMEKLAGEVAVLETRTNDFIELIKKGSVSMSNTRLTEVCTVLQYTAQLVTDVSTVARLIDASEKVQIYIINKVKDLK